MTVITVVNYIETVYLTEILVYANISIQKKILLKLKELYDINLLLYIYIVYIW